MLWYPSKAKDFRVFAPIHTRKVRKSEAARFAPHIVVAALFIVMLIVGFLIWSGREIDRIASERDRSIVSLVLAQSIERVGHAQESSTVWDDALREARRRPIDQDWMDLNLGIWFDQYAGFNEVYVLSPESVPIYAMRGGKRKVPETYIAIEDVADPLVMRLRRTRGSGKVGVGGVPMISPGASDLAILRGRPAIVSAKPILSDSGSIVQKPGSEPVHIGVVYLDNDFFARLGSNYGLAQARYEISPSRAWGEASVPLRSRDGDVIGYFVWHPFAPGSEVTRSVGPVVLLVLLLSAVVIYLLAGRLASRTLDLEESRSEARHQALHDALTGLANRAMFEGRLDAALSRCRREGGLVGLLYIDLDRFKQVNDSLGHPAGDALIRQVARRLTSEVRGYDMVARLGGDEFAVLVVEPESREAIGQICERIVAEIERPFDVAGAQAFIGASIGVAVAPDHGTDRTELTRRADIALYKAKMEGRSRFTFFEASMDEVVRLRETTNRELRQALLDCDEQLKVFYQPVYSTVSGRMVAVEALLRWNHPVNGLVNPAGFIQQAEESGLIEVLGGWVLRKAVDDAMAWPDLRISVNVSPVQMRSRAFVDNVRAVLNETGLDPRRLELELTETALMSASEEVSASLKALRRIGVACALDDFGTGYSSLSHIRDIAVDRIKIDRSFVHAVNTGPGAALVEAIVNVARANGLNLTAEGVETEAQLSHLRSLGCHEVQGYLLSRPVPYGDITRLLEGGAHSFSDTGTESS
ncbi:MAG: EAL domain-containing protein [Novosphingobium sp.]|nr:EAL domain-containing protein [Novosphingobium sp.]